MAVEIERKFLVRDDRWRGRVVESLPLRQGYLANTRTSSIRLRIASGRAWLSVKAMQPGPARLEFEYEIPESDAVVMLGALAEGPLVEKVRHRVDVDGNVFEVDEFQGRNRGLVLAEIELNSVEQSFPHPEWLGEEVTDAPRYYNFRLAIEPFGRWPQEAQRAAQAGRRTAAEDP